MHAVKDHNDDTNGDCFQRLHAEWRQQRGREIARRVQLWDSQGRYTKLVFPAILAGWDQTYNFCFLRERFLARTHQPEQSDTEKKTKKRAEDENDKWKLLTKENREEWRRRRRGKKDDGDLGLLTGRIKHNQSCRFVLLQQLGKTLRQQEAFFKPTSQIPSTSSSYRNDLHHALREISALPQQSFADAWKLICSQASAESLHWLTGPSTPLFLLFLISIRLFFFLLFLSDSITAPYAWISAHGHWVIYKSTVIIIIIT